MWPILASVIGQYSSIESKSTLEFFCRIDSGIIRHSFLIQPHVLLQALLISTTVRSCLCLTSQNFRILAIGSQPRKVRGTFGGVIFPAAGSKVLLKIFYWHGRYCENWYRNMASWHYLLPKPCRRNKYWHYFNIKIAVLGPISPTFTILAVFLNYQHFSSFFKSRYAYRDVSLPKLCRRTRRYQPHGDISPMPGVHCQNFIFKVLHW